MSVSVSESVSVSVSVSVTVSFSVLLSVSMCVCVCVFVSDAHVCVPEFQPTLIGRARPPQIQEAIDKVLIAVNV